MKAFACPNCRGRGTYCYLPCSVCLGKGQNYVSFDSIECSTCNSSGRVAEGSKICSTCKGTGRTYIDKDARAIV